jgi:23S rRNA (guanosine2251-2'-O)-methyltransferase
MSELLYGRHAVLEALRADRRQVYRLWVEGDANQQTGGIVGEILAAAKRSNLPVRYLQGGMFDKFRNEQTNAQGVALETGDYPYVEWEDCLALARQRQEQPLLLILDHLQDPQNLGTLIRTAEAMGVHGILMPDRRAARITPAVSNASAGAVEHLRVAQVTNINRAIDDLKQNNIWVAGLDGDPTVPPANEVRLDGALAIVVGSEGEGLSRLTRERCDFLLRLPMHGQVESLNAAVAGSIVLYLAAQARSAA